MWTIRRDCGTQLGACRAIISQHFAIKSRLDVLVDYQQVPLIDNQATRTVQDSVATCHEAAYEGTCVGIEFLHRIGIGVADVQGSGDVAESRSRLSKFSNNRCRRRYLDGLREVRGYRADTIAPIRFVGVVAIRDAFVMTFSPADSRDSREAVGSTGLRNCHPHNSPTTYRFLSIYTASVASPIAVLP